MKSTPQLERHFSEEEKFLATLPKEMTVLTKFSKKKLKISKNSVLIEEFISGNCFVQFSPKIFLLHIFLNFNLFCGLKF